jgi:hypothetical protein
VIGRVSAIVVAPSDAGLGSNSAIAIRKARRKVVIGARFAGPSRKADD